MLDTSYLEFLKTRKARLGENTTKSVGKVDEKLVYRSVFRSS